MMISIYISMMISRWPIFTRERHADGRELRIESAYRSLGSTQEHFERDLPGGHSIFTMYQCLLPLYFIFISERGG